MSRSSVSLWVRDVEFVASPRRMGARRREPNALQRRKAAEIAAMDILGVERLGTLSDQAFLAAGAALYAGEGAKADGCVKFANSNPQMIAFFCAWPRHFFEVDERRLRIHLYLHEGLDLQAAIIAWSRLTGVAIDQFIKPYRAVPDVGIRHNKHEHGCATVIYSCSKTHRAVMGLCRALLSSTCFPG